jgi:hypothetical protein
MESNRSGAQSDSSIGNEAEKWEKFINDMFE